MIDQHKIGLFTELFNQAESVLIVYAPDALRDHLFAATALYKTFKEHTNKEVTLLSSTNLFESESDIVYLDETKTEIGHRNLCITFDYNQDKVEKITSAVDEQSGKLHLTIKPRKGVTPLSKESVTFSYTGAEADMVILVGVDDLESLEQLYIGYENLYQRTALVSINSYETSFGNLKIDIIGSSSLSEYVAQMLFAFGYTLDHEVATNLLAGIDEETENLESYLATADTFEVVAQLLRAGARRFARESQNDDEYSDSYLSNNSDNYDDLGPFSSDQSEIFSGQVNEAMNETEQIQDEETQIAQTAPGYPVRDMLAGARVTGFQQKEPAQAVNTQTETAQTQEPQTRTSSDYDEDKVFTISTQAEDESYERSVDYIAQSEEAELAEQAKASGTIEGAQANNKLESNKKSSKQPTQPKRKRGRPKGSKNKKKSPQKTQAQAPAQQASTRAPKPGDLDYVPSGFGPTGG